MNPSNSATEHNAWWRLVRAFLAWWAALADRVHARGDAEARIRGWEISTKPLSMTRVYHDPRFALLRVCPSCQGHGGGATGPPCVPCGDSGVTRFDPGGVRR